MNRKRIFKGKNAEIVLFPSSWAHKFGAKLSLACLSLACQARSRLDKIQAYIPKRSDTHTFHRITNGGDEDMNLW